MLARRFGVLALLGAFACGGGSPATKPAEGPRPCLIGYTALQPIVAGAIELPPELVAARDRFHAATKLRNGDPEAAAAAFLDAARAFRAVPDDSSFLEQALDDAEASYENAIASYARGGLLEARGRAALRAEATADPRMADRIAAALDAAPADCERR